MNEALEPNVVKLNIDEANSLSFDVKIEGDQPATPMFRLVCETQRMDISFVGHPDGNEVHFELPALKGIIPEGTHDARMEVVVGDRLVVPISFKMMLTTPVKVTVESIRAAAPRSAGPVISVKHKPSPKQVERSAATVEQSKKRPDAPPRPAKQHKTLSELFRDRAKKR